MFWKLALRIVWNKGTLKTVSKPCRVLFYPGIALEAEIFSTTWQWQWECYCHWESSNVSKAAECGIDQSAIVLSSYWKCLHRVRLFLFSAVLWFAHLGVCFLFPWLNLQNILCHVKALTCVLVCFMQASKSSLQLQLEKTIDIITQCSKELLQKCGAFLRAIQQDVCAELSTPALAIPLPQPPTSSLLRDHLCQHR